MVHRRNDSEQSGGLDITPFKNILNEFYSRDISKKVKSGKHIRALEGKFMGTTAPFGYRKDPQDKNHLIVDEATAPTVRLIYSLALEGYGTNRIGKVLYERKIPKPSYYKQEFFSQHDSGSEDYWYDWKQEVITRILRNEKYKGDALLQKSFTVDFLTKKSKLNEGEVPQYYVANSHPAIIEPEIFDLVQYEMKQRKAEGRFTSSTHPFSGKIVCGHCGGFYGSKVWHSNTPNRVLVWQCNEKHRGKGCRTPHLTEGDIRRAFLAAFNEVLGNRAEIMEAYREVMEALTDTADLDAEQERLQNEGEVVMGLIRKVISDNAQKAMDQAEYERKYNGYCGRYEAARLRLAKIGELRLGRIAKRTKISLFLKELASREGLVAEFDEELWYATVDHVAVYEDKRMVFTFRDHTQVEVPADKWKAA